MNMFRFVVGKAAFAALALAAGSVYAQAAGAPAIVGEATMVIGVAHLFSADGASHGVERGTPIRVGDRVETEAGGHVHFRFVDGGRLSIRPSSRLQVESYNHSAQPAQTAIKFRLDEGVVRSITGAWGEAARDRFRLNTPVAAIGVKGTDFVVRSDTDKTSASVYTGAIVLSPLVGGCVATLGPCHSGTEKLLSEDMKGQMLELSRQQATPQFVPLVDLMAQQRRLNTRETVARADKPLAASASREDAGADKAVVNESRSAEVLVVGTTSSPVQPLGPPSVTQLAWGRFAGPVQGDEITRAFAEASASGRQLTVGNGAYTLFRAPSDTGLLQTAETAATFRLAGGAGQLVSGNARNQTVEGVRVDGGTLAVDFARASFTTQLDVSNPTIGSNTLSATGVVRPNGYLLGQGGNAYVAGALSTDAKEAGYFFQKTLPAGELSGVTLWGR